MRPAHAVPTMLAALLAAMLGMQPTLAADEPLQLWDEGAVRVRSGVTVQARLHASVKPGYFVVAPGAPPRSKLRGLTLRIKPVADLKLGRPLYPPETNEADLPGLPPFPAYEGRIAVSVPITVPAKPTWSTRKLEGTLEYQACTATACDKPAAIPVTLEVELTADTKRRQLEENLREPPRPPVPPEPAPPGWRP